MSAIRKPVRIPPRRPASAPAGELSAQQLQRAAIDRHILVVEDIARILRCTVDRARRIPRDELPNYVGPGRARLYIYDDVISYVRQQRRVGLISDERINDVRSEVLDSAPDSGRERSARRRTR